MFFSYRKSVNCSKVGFFFRLVRSAKLLVQYGADVNIPDNDGYTPLHFAVKYGKII